MEREHKSFAAIATKVLDPDLGIVEHIVAVMGNKDLGKDVIHPGAFRKTIDERGLKVKVLDQHDTRSVEAVIGRPLELREMGRSELPSKLVEQYPDATGALMAKTQFLLDTNRGREVFARIKAGAVDEYSIGYDPIVTDFSTIETPEGQKETVRNLRELRLWEYSPVIFGMNPATQTLSAKEDIEPEEGKPWKVFSEDGRFCVYKVDADGNKTGSSRGCHDTRDEALAQMRALYANAPDEEMAVEGEGAETKVMKTEADGQHPASHYLVVEDAEKPSTWHLRVKGPDGKPDHRLMGAAWAALHGGYRGNVYSGPGKAEAIAKLTRMYSSEDMDTPKEGLDPEEMKEILERLNRIEALLTERDHDAPTEMGAADDTPEDEDAGPDIPPTTERLAMIAELEQLLEVE